MENKTNIIKGLVGKYVCDYANCSDSNDVQYPKCEIINDDKKYYTCACVKFKISKLTEEIMDKLKIADTSGRCPYCNEVQFKDFHKPEDCAMKPELADTSGNDK